MSGFSGWFAAEAASDFVLRLNLNEFVVVETLLTLLDLLPGQGVYWGEVIPFRDFSPAVATPTRGSSAGGGRRSTTTTSRGEMMEVPGHDDALDVCPTGHL